MHQYALRARWGAGLSAAVAACAIAGFAVSSSSQAATKASAASATSSCGPKPGVAAKGSPITLGAINTKQPGTDFSDIENMEGAYFACVNANGGVNGHPIKLIKLTEPTQPPQIAADAKQLVADHVLGISGTSSILECTINHKYWEGLGYKVIAAGIAPECYGTPNYADVNMGPRYSSDGAVQYVIGLHPSRIVFDQSNVPGTGYIKAGPDALASHAHVPVTNLAETVPITDANSVALKEVQNAGQNGAVVLNFTPPEALLILQAAQKLNIENKVKAWACSTPCDTDYLAHALGSQWNGKLFVNAELAPPDVTNTPTMKLYKAILSQYGTDVSGGIGSFSQMGFTMGEIATYALDGIKGAYTKKSVNAAFEGVKNFNTGMLCQPWTYGPYKLHIANNADWTVTPANGKMVTKQGCTDISSVDPQIAAYRKAIK
jgi:branched-chain amino acid transport system substrate-binding protein